MTFTETSTRDRLLSAGADLFIELGYAETSLRTLAERVGVKAGSIYYHFASKDVLLTEILQLGMQHMSEAFDAAAPVARPPRQRLHTAVSAHLYALFAHGPFTVTHVAVFHRAPADVRATIVPLRDAYEAKWVDLFDSLQEDGAIRGGVDTHLARLALLGAMNGALGWFDLDGDRPLTALVDEIAQLHWRGIRSTTNQEDE